MRRAAATPVVAAAALAVSLSACAGDGGLGLARQACGHVDRSLVLYARSEATGSPRVAADDKELAAVQLEDALPLAAQANSAGGQWNPLMTTLSELNRVQEGQLVPALRAACALADTGPAANPAQTQRSQPPGSSTSAPTPSTLPGQKLP